MVYPYRQPIDRTGDRIDPSAPDQMVPKQPDIPRGSDEGFYFNRYIDQRYARKDEVASGGSETREVVVLATNDLPTTTTSTFVGEWTQTDAGTAFGITTSGFRVTFPSAFPVFSQIFFEIHQDDTLIYRRSIVFMFMETQSDTATTTWYPRIGRSRTPYTIGVSRGNRFLIESVVGATIPAKTVAKLTMLP